MYNIFLFTHKDIDYLSSLDIKLSKPQQDFLLKISRNPSYISSLGKREGKTFLSYCVILLLCKKFGEIEIYTESKNIVFVTNKKFPFNFVKVLDPDLESYRQRMLWMDGLEDMCSRYQKISNEFDIIRLAKNHIEMVHKISYVLS